jgi:hypothetical protein
MLLFGLLILAVCTKRSGRDDSGRDDSERDDSERDDSGRDDSRRDPVRNPLISPFGKSEDICFTTNQDIRVRGFPGTPGTIVPFSDTYKMPERAVFGNKECRSDGHCIRTLSIDIYESQKRVFDNAVPMCKNKPPTTFLTYNGLVPGPTITAPSGHETLIRFNNKIEGGLFGQNFKPCNANGRRGRPISVHLHGSASLSPFDGWAEDETCTGETKDYVYPNNRPVTGWYHDHALHITADNAYFGLAGMYVVSAKPKDGGCGEAWNLADVEEREMILSDKVLTSNCQLSHDVANAHSFSKYATFCQKLSFSHFKCCCIEAVSLKVEK